MSNMSYCRFENTSNDLRDCVSALQEMSDNQNMSDEACEEQRVEQFKNLSASEKSAFKSMVESCEEYMELAQDLLEDN
jgi:hypothetical protein